MTEDAEYMNNDPMLDLKMSRYECYKSIRKWASETAFARDKLEVAEFGGAYHNWMRKIFTEAGHVYHEMPNYPEIDIMRLNPATVGIFDVAIIDQVLEHVIDPPAALESLRGILAKDGWLIVCTPFLVPIHDTDRGYDDYWRFTRSGLRVLLERAGFDSTFVYSWGNWQYVSHVLKHGFGQRAKRDYPEPDFNDEKYPYTIWAFAQRGNGHGTESV